jgi:hypothetical protein
MTYSIRYGALRPFFSFMALGPMFSRVEHYGDEVRVRMGWAFWARFPSAAVVRARRRRRALSGVGVHGFAGRWLVNGATSGIVRMELSPSQRGYVLGLPVRLRILDVSLKDPDAFVAAFRH